MTGKHACIVIVEAQANVYKVTGGTGGNAPITITHIIPLLSIEKRGRKPNTMTDNHVCMVTVKS